MAKTKGWICPKCSKVYAPTVTECYACNAVQAYKPTPMKWYWSYYPLGTYTVKVNSNATSTLWSSNESGSMFKANAIGTSAIGQEASN